jgi:hypothetical protein
MSTPAVSARDVTKTYRMGDVEVAALKGVDGMGVFVRSEKSPPVLPESRLPSKEGFPMLGVWRSRIQRLLKIHERIDPPNGPC